MSTSSEDIHGLSYHPSFVSSLPVLVPRPHPHQPIRAISAPQFAQIHLKYLLSHAPDHVIFPFLHGLEGDNEAQNMFFASASASTSAARYGPGRDNHGSVRDILAKVPKFRGLIWVACDDDISPSSTSASFSVTAIRSRHDTFSSTVTSTSDEDQLISSDSDDYSSSSDEEEEFQCFGPMPMDIDLDLDVGVDVDIHARMELDPTLQGPVVKGCPMNPELADSGDVGAHMHPVQMRGAGVEKDHPTRTNTHDRRSSQASTTSTTSYNSSSPSPSSPVPSTLPTPSLSSSPSANSPTRSSISIQTTPPYPHTIVSSQSSRPSSQPPAQSQVHSSPIPFSSSPSPLPFPPLLTSSFRARELLREVRSEFGDVLYGGDIAAGYTAARGGSSVEFVEPRVPEGISLRNFGIQTPIFATLSDIVVYSPRGDTKSALLLAEKFKQAIESKYQSRLTRLRHYRSRIPSNSNHTNRDQEMDDVEEELVKYNVFVLDATWEEMHDKLSHLVSRVEDVSVPHAYTDGTDAHTRGRGSCSQPSTPSSSSDEEGLQVCTPMDAAERGQVGITKQATGKKENDKEKKAKKKLLRANTINFAQREKEEMRDLTRASEILTFFPPHHQHASDDTISGSSTLTHWDPSLGQIFLGNSSDVPLPPDDPHTPARRHWRRARNGQFSDPNSNGYDELGMDKEFEAEEEGEVEDGADFCEEGDAFDWRTNDPNTGLGYDICIECDDMAPFPTAMHMRAADDHVRRLETEWAERCLKRFERVHRRYPHVDDDMNGSGSCSSSSGDFSSDREKDRNIQIPPRPPPNANEVIHLPFPSSVSYSTSLLPFISWLEGLIHPVSDPATFDVLLKQKEKSVPPSSSQMTTPTMKSIRRGSSAGSGGSFGPSSLPPPNLFPTSFLPTPGSGGGSKSSYTRVRSTSATYAHSNTHTPTTSSSSSARHPQQQQLSTPTQPIRTRPLKILIYSADGYTESSSLALCLLMAIRGLSLPEAYLELQLEKKRSFFVYQGEVGAMKRIEARLEKDRHNGRYNNTNNNGAGVGPGVNGRRAAQTVSFASLPSIRNNHNNSGHGGSEFFGSGASKTMNEMQPASAHPLSSSIPTESPSMMIPSPMPMKRPRACTLPQLPSFSDHQVWFNDPRFDGSFPSRVLPFLYLGNLNHASNAYMLHALGITHVVSVGECALVPPPSHADASSGPTCTTAPSHNAHFVQGKGPGGHGSLWIEEREGRIKVLDIKGVCDDGIDTLEPQLAPICDWIDRARADGGKVLVHCRVGVSRSATVTIAYVMKHLSLPLVDAYLIVRSRRLSVLIQPNMRLLYNLLGWEVKLARERAGDDEEKLRHELARCLNWPFLAKEVHALNEKYLRA